MNLTETNLPLNTAHNSLLSQHVARGRDISLTSSESLTPDHQHVQLNLSTSFGMSLKNLDVTYDKPLINTKNTDSRSANKKDTGQVTEVKHQHDDSNETSNEEQYNDIELEQIDSLKSVHNEVQLHERAHSAVGGQHAGSPNYSYKTGPDGIKYAVSGEVSIDTSKVANDPQASLLKARQIKAAALAPSEPSSQDRRIAAKADRMATQAKHDILIDNQEGSSNRSSTYVESSIPEHFSEINNLKVESKVQAKLINRIQQINNFYQNSSTIKSTSTFQTQI